MLSPVGMDVTSISATEIQLGKPRMRGWSHAFGAFLAVPAVYFLVDAAQEDAGELGALIYGVTLVMLLGVSATYHVPFWSTAVRAKLRLLDHSMIYVLLGGSYTPFCLLTGGWVKDIVLPMVWIMSIAGVLGTLFVPDMRRSVKAGSYVAMGWISLPLAFEWYAALGQKVLFLLFVGGVIYTAGAVVYTRKSPNPSPAVFGYHEVFHLAVVVGCAVHYAAVWLTVSR